jgi:TRAP-type mannitol/chloroaromatic compound transport system substrate-binding protein
MQPLPPPQQPRMPSAIPAPRINPAALPQLTWNLQNAFPKQTSTSGPLFAQHVSELSQRRLTVRHFDSGELVPGVHILEAVASSTIDAGYAPGTYFSGKDRAFALMAAIPFGFAPREQLAFRRRPDVSAIFDRLSGQHGVVARPCGLFGRPGEFWLKKRIATRSDLAGMKLRIGPLFGQEIFKELGVQVVILPPGDIFPAFEKGVIDGAQFGGPTEDQVLGLALQGKYYYYPSSVYPSVVIDLFVNRKAWDALPPAGRQIIEQACADAVEAMVSDYERKDREALARFEREGITVAPLPVSIEKEMYAASRKVLTKSAGENPVIRDVMAIVEQIRPNTIAAQIP